MEMPNFERADWKPHWNQPGYTDTTVATINGHEVMVARSESNPGPWEIWIDEYWRDCYPTQEEAQEVAQDLAEGEEPPS